MPKNLRNQASESNVSNVLKFIVNHIGKGPSVPRRMQASQEEHCIIPLIRTKTMINEILCCVNLNLKMGYISIGNDRS